MNSVQTSEKKKILILFFHGKLIELINMVTRAWMLALVEETGELCGNHRPWRSDRYPATCRCRESNMGHSDEKQGFYPCTIQAPGFETKLEIKSLINKAVPLFHNSVDSLYTCI